MTSDEKCHRLWELIHAGQDDGEEAERLRDELTDEWHTLSEEEQNQRRRLLQILSVK